jgi:hypothetical protein
MSFLSHLIDRLPEGIQRAEDTIVGSSLIHSPRILRYSESFMTTGILDHDSEAQLMSTKRIR